MLGGLLRPDAGKLVWLLIGAGIVAYTKLGRFMPGK